MSEGGTEAEQLARYRIRDAILERLAEERERQRFDLNAALSIADWVMYHFEPRGCQTARPLRTGGLAMCTLRRFHHPLPCVFDGDVVPPPNSDTPRRFVA